MSWLPDKVSRLHIHMLDKGIELPHMSELFPDVCLCNDHRDVVPLIKGASQAREIMIDHNLEYYHKDANGRPLSYEIIDALVEHPEVTWLCLKWWMADLSWAWPLYHELTTLIVMPVYDLTALLQPLAHPGCRIVTLDIGECKLPTLPHMDTPNYIHHNTSLRTLVVRNSDSRISDHIFNSVACNATLDELVFVRTPVNAATAWCCLKESSVLIFGVDSCFEHVLDEMVEESIPDVRRWCERARWAIGAWPDALCEHISRYDTVQRLGEYKYPDPHNKRDILRYLRHKRLADMPRLPARVAARTRALYECAGKILPDHVIRDIADEMHALWNTRK